MKTICGMMLAAVAVGAKEEEEREETPRIVPEDFTVSKVKVKGKRECFCVVFCLCCVLCLCVFYVVAFALSVVAVSYVKWVKTVKSRILETAFWVLLRCLALPCLRRDELAGDVAGGGQVSRANGQHGAPHGEGC